MHYDPIKASLGKVFNKSTSLRILFYKLLDLLFLRAWYIRKELKKWAVEHASEVAILDAGFGYGQYSYFLSGFSKKWKITAVDIKQEQVDDCTVFFNKLGKTNIHFEYADLTEFSHPDKYDLILNVDVMEHILDDVKVLKSFYSSLKKNGMLLISTPSDQGGSDVHEHDEKSFIEEHVRDGYSISNMTEKLKSVGFSKIECKYAYGKPGQLSWKLSMKIPIQMLGVTKLFFILIPFYYLAVYPIAFILNGMDVNGNHASGTGLIVKAWK